MVWSRPRRSRRRRARVLSGCGNLSLSALHDPLYRASAHLSTITATATDTKDGVTKVRVDVDRGRSHGVHGDRRPHAEPLPCRAENAVTLRAQDGLRVPEHEEPSRPVPSRSSSATGGSSRTPTSARSGSGGRRAPGGGVAPAGTADAGGLNILGLHFTMPWETARPVVWRTDAPAGGTDLADEIDVGFFPDADFGANYQAFTDGLRRSPSGLSTTRRTTREELHALEEPLQPLGGAQPERTGRVPRVPSREAPRRSPGSRTAT